VSTKIYIERNCERYGPYSQEEVTAGLADGTFLPTDLACRCGYAVWVPLQKPLAGERQNPCPQCRGELSIPTENPNRGTGVIVLVLGILFAPVCLGIPFLWGWLDADFRSPAPTGTAAAAGELSQLEGSPVTLMKRLW
jgi:hypothetical protein